MKKIIYTLLIGLLVSCSHTMEFKTKSCVGDDIAQMNCQK